MSSDGIGLILIAFNATLISALSTLVVWFWRSAPGSRWLFRGMLAITIWNLFALLQRFTPDLSLVTLFYKLVYIGADTTTPLLLIFVLEYVFQRSVSNRQIAVLFIIPAVGILAAFTNEFHHLYWLGVTPNPLIDGDFIFTHGPLYWLSLLYNYLCGTASLLLLAATYLRKRGPYRRQVSIMLVSCIFPYISGLLYSLDSSIFSNLDVLPNTFALVGLGLVFSIYSQKMLDLLPVAREILVENMKEGVIVIDRQNRVADINPAARGILKLDEPLGKGMAEIFAGDDGMMDLLQRDCYCLSELNLGKAGNRLYELQLVPLKTGASSMAGKLLIIRDVTLYRQVQTEKVLRNQNGEMMGITDSITGLFNRRHAEKRLLWEIERAERYHLPLSLGMLDIDHFKRVNDRTGHICGDQVIMAFSDLLRHEIRNDDFTARIGGEEFLIIFPQTDMHGAFRAMERVRKCVEETVMPCHNVNITISGGITTFRPGDTCEQIVQRVNEQLLTAKSSGRNCVSCDPLGVTTA